MRISTAELRSQMTGRLAMRDAEIDALSEVCTIPGDHLEIGVLWGGSTIVAALNKPRFSRIYSIDTMSGGYWQDGDPGMPDHSCPSVEAIGENLARFDICDRVTIVRASSDPFPLPCIRPSTALIDGGHSYGAALADWRNVSAITSDRIIIHDVVTDKHPGLLQAVGDFVLTSSHWSERERIETMLIMERTS